jgi:hypothetical protein
MATAAQNQRSTQTTVCLLSFLPKQLFRAPHQELRAHPLITLSKLLKLQQKRFGACEIAGSSVCFSDLL